MHDDVCHRQSNSGGRESSGAVCRPADRPRESARSDPHWNRRAGRADRPKRSEIAGAHRLPPAICLLHCELSICPTQHNYTEQNKTKKTQTERLACSINNNMESNNKYSHPTVPSSLFFPFGRNKRELGGGGGSSSSATRREREETRGDPPTPGR